MLNILYNKSVGIPFKDIPIGDEITYRLAISLGYRGIQLTLINFQYM